MDSLIKSLQALVVALQAYFAAPIPKPPTVTLTEVPQAPIGNLLNLMSLGIQKREGWILNPPSRSVRNHSPGNVRYSPVGYLPIYLPVGKDADNFAIFKNYATGLLYLKNLILEKSRKSPSDNLYDFFSKYAPKSDGNDSIAYAEFVAQYMGVNPSTFRVSQLLG